MKLFKFIFHISTKELILLKEIYGSLFNFIFLIFLFKKLCAISFIFLVLPFKYITLEFNLGFCSNLSDNFILGKLEYVLKGFPNLVSFSIVSMFFLLLLFLVLTFSI